MVKYVYELEIVLALNICIKTMTNTEKLITKGCNFPSWIDSEQLIKLVTSLAGEELYAEFGFKEATSTSKFLSKFFPGKPKSVRFNNYVRELLI